jgi:hypothetical protein
LTPPARVPDNQRPFGGTVAVCTYELYLATFKDARTALRERDGGRLAAMRAKAASRGGGATEACELALADAEASRGQRSRLEVCRPLCDTRCERAV